jgi:hypothetical protein
VEGVDETDCCVEETTCELDVLVCCVEDVVVTEDFDPRRA